MSGRAGGGDPTRAVLPFVRGGVTPPLPVPLVEARPTGRRVMVLWFPGFSIERCGFTLDGPAVGLTEQRPQTTVVTALNRTALNGGVQLKMRTREARLLLPDLQLESRDVVGEAADWQNLLRSLETYSDCVWELAVQEVALEIGATSGWFGGEALLVEQLKGWIETLGHETRFSVADDPWIARSVALFGTSGTLVPRGSTQEVANLSLRALAEDIDVELLSELRSLGVKTIGHLAALDSAGVSGRFGAAGLELHRRALGQCRVPPPEGIESRPPLRGGVFLGSSVETLGQIDRMIGTVCQQLAQQLLSRSEVASTIELMLELDGGGELRLELRLARASRDFNRLQSLVRARLARLAVKAPIIALYITVTEAFAERGWQPSWIDRADLSEPLPDLIERLTQELGEGAVVTPQLVPSWKPEEAWVAWPWGDEPKRDIVEGGPRAVTNKRWREDSVWGQEWKDRGMVRSRPAMLLGAPQHLIVEVEATIPISASHFGKTTPLVVLSGPERIVGEWWAKTAMDRSYWVVKTKEGIAWIFNDLHTGTWWLHGWFD